MEGALLPPLGIEDNARFSISSVLKISVMFALQDDINDLLTGLLGPYWEIRSPIFFVRLELARAVRKSEGFVFPVSKSFIISS